MKIFILLIFNLLVVSVVSAQDYSIRGFIYNKTNGEPMAFEKIRLMNASDSSTISGALTDLNGFFSLPKIAPGRYIFKVYNFYYETYTKNVEVKLAK